MRIYLLFLLLLVGISSNLYAEKWYDKYNKQEITCKIKGRTDSATVKFGYNWVSFDVSDKEEKMLINIMLDATEKEEVYRKIRGEFYAIYNAKTKIYEIKNSQTKKIDSSFELINCVNANDLY